MPAEGAVEDHCEHRDEEKAAFARPPSANASSDKGLMANFGLLLTGRLELRNDLLSALAGVGGLRLERIGRVAGATPPYPPDASPQLHVAVGNSVWDERYFVLTRKGLHYYVREKGDLKAR